jgi:hypothetical protein
VFARRIPATIIPSTSVLLFPVNHLASPPFVAKFFQDDAEIEPAIGIFEEFGLERFR